MPRYGSPTVLGVLLLISVTTLVSPELVPHGSKLLAEENASLQQVSFRVVTDIFVSTQKEPVQQTLTLFSQGVAYDISFNDPNQITLVDPQRKRIVLLNKEQQIQTEIDLQQLHEFIDAARKQAESSDLAPYLQGAAQVQITDEGVTVGDRTLQYHSTLQEPREEPMAAQYAQVADALALLNGRSGVPPFARLSLNRAVAEQKALPAEITRTIGSDSQPFVVRCKLHTNWRLSRDDEQKIAEIGKMLVNFEVVSATKFFASRTNVADRGAAQK
ncbi:MAG: hypothetical protein KDA45_03025 [Planctomycetales bacterium]|nr:hypothetical protein [Planctomycetales bacterium]